MILVRPQGDAAFEQAIFVVKDSAQEVSEQELLRQAKDAVQSEEGNHPGNSRMTKALSFLCGAGSVGLFWILLNLL